MSTSSYVLSGPEEKERLQLQARLWQPKTEILIDEIGIQPGWRCLDVGCGAMGILGPLSRRVGSRGKVVGIDKDPALLAAARAYVAEEGLTNVEIVEADARHTELPRESFDFVHARFILVFGQADQILREMLALTRPGGLIAVQETDQRSWHFYPENETWPHLKEALESAFLQIGGNANLGRDLLPMLQTLGVLDTQLRADTMAIPGGHPYMKMPLIGANGFREVIIKAGIMTPEIFSKTMEQMEVLIARSSTYATWFTLLQAWGKKPA
jgi:ubiquinone/menaquinone biosynthesis C-methylase UbiE